MTDNEGKLVGASNAVYSGTGTTEKSNNRTLKTATVGMAAMNELRNHSFEASSPAWTLSGVNGADTNVVVRTMTGTEAVRTGEKGCKGWIRPGKNSTVSATRTTDRLYAGVEYTLSAYVNTSQCTSFRGEGVYLKVTGLGIPASEQKSESVNYQTSAGVDQGWVRLSVTFTPQSSGTCTIGVYNQGAGPYFYVDDVQLERAEGPSSLNMLENGSLRYWGHGWKMGSLASFVEGESLFTGEDAYSLQIQGDAYTESSAYQEVPIHQTGKTYVLSGWAKANAVPDNEEKAEGEDAAARDKYKQFGLRAILTYSTGEKEYHYVPFHPDVTEWQYTSTAIVPKKGNTEVASIRVECAYERNQNTAYFDNLSLTQEAAQTMKYDEDGNLISVKSTGNEEESSDYEEGNLLTLRTGGNGTYTYDYDEKHNLKSVSNGVVQDTLTHDGMGNVTKSVMESAKTEDGSRIVSSSTYTNGGNLVSSVTERGNTTKYEYNGSYYRMTGQESDVTDPSNTKASYTYDAAGRTKSTTITRIGNTGTIGTVTYDYTKGLLTKLTRNTNGQNQVYNLSYDTLGNLIKTQVGNRTLMTYTYGAKNGPLERQTYGNGAYTEYEYDSLGRASRTSTSDGDTYTYRYTGDGQLYEMKDSNGGEEITYRYQYDSIGRLIGTTQSGGTAELQAMYQYDSNNRLTRMNYSIPGIVDSGEESFYYNGDGSGMVADLKNASEGVLKGMALFSNSWILYEYDELSRLSRRRVGEVLEEHYSYLPGSESGTTTTLPETYYTTAKGSSTKLSGYRYAYDARNNITRITDLKNNSYWSYAYDEVGQLRYATTYNASGVAQDRYKYTYNRAGNLTEWKIQNGDNTETYEEHTYTYGNSEWKDLLTAFDGHTITYDVNGNPLSYYNGKSYSMSWRNGRELEQVKVGGKTYRYEYDGNGQRTRKSNEDGGYTEYYLVDGLAVAERRYYAGGSERYTMRYLYDESNSPVGLGLKYPGESLWTYFYFEKNVQGDVIGLYRSDYSSSRGYYGTLVARYSYDPYGRPVSMTNASGTTISQTAYNVAAYNPFRYRGYRYDGETGLYYLQSRYYDPETCRFINADCSVSTGQGLNGHNMFSYSLNDPINRVDEDGQASIWYYMKINGRMGLIHRMVQMQIEATSASRVGIEMWVEKDEKRIGRADIVDSDGNVWEVKHGGSKAGVAMIATAQAQASRYIGGEAVRNDWELKNLGPAGQFSGSFTVSCLDDTYLVTYTTPAPGAVLYHVRQIEEEKKADYVYEPAIIKAKIRSKAPSAAGALAVVTSAVGAAAVGLGACAIGGGFWGRSLQMSYFM